MPPRKGSRKSITAVANNKTTTKNCKDNQSTAKVTDATEKLAQSDEDVPNVLFAPDGRKFFPCKHCCRAFAFKRTLTTHLRTCSFRVVEVSDSEDEKEPPKKQKKTYKRPDVTKHIVTPTKTKASITTGAKPMKNNAKKGISILTNIVIKEKDSELRTLSTTIQQIPKKTTNSKTFPEQLALLGGSVTLTPIEKKPKAETFVCKDCHQVFSDRMKFLFHRKSEHGKRRSITLSPESLKIYDKVFMASNTNICPVCQKPQARMGWKRHLQTHSSEFKFFCGICRKGFKRIDHKKAHEKRHVITIDEVYTK